MPETPTANLDQHIRIMLGDLVLRVAALTAENEALKTALAQRAPSPPAETTPGA